MRIYFNLNTVVGKVLEKKSCTAWFIKNFIILETVRLSRRRGTDILPRVCILCFLFYFIFLFFLLCFLFFLFSSEKNIKNADSDNSVTVKSSTEKQVSFK